MSDSEKQKQWAAVLENVIRDSARSRADVLNTAQQRSKMSLTQEIADTVNTSTVRIDRMIEEAARRAANGDTDLYLMLFHELQSPYPKIKELLHSQKSASGGQKSKRRLWAVRAAEMFPTWDDLPTAHAPIEFEDLLVCVYRDGNKLCAADIDDPDADPKTIARSTFEKRYQIK